MEVGNTILPILFSQRSAFASFLRGVPGVARRATKQHSFFTLNRPFLKFKQDSIFDQGAKKNVVQILYEKIVQVIVFIGTTENYFYVFVLPLLVLPVLLKEVRPNFSISLVGAQKMSES